MSTTTKKSDDSVFESRMDFYIETCKDAGIADEVTRVFGEVYEVCRTNDGPMVLASLTHVLAETIGNLYVKMCADKNLTRDLSVVAMTALLFDHCLEEVIRAKNDVSRSLVLAERKKIAKEMVKLKGLSEQEQFEAGQRAAKGCLKTDPRKP
jgi:cell division protein ZapA (FtsZ GTPase activity inhibitor)